MSSSEIKLLNHNVQNKTGVKIACSGLSRPFSFVVLKGEEARSEDIYFFAKQTQFERQAFCVLHQQFFVYCLKCRPLNQLVISFIGHVCTRHTRN